MLLYRKQLYHKPFRNNLIFHKSLIVLSELIGILSVNSKCSSAAFAKILIGHLSPSIEKI